MAARMGNADLRELAAIESISMDELTGSVVAIDAHNWLYRYLTTTIKFTASDAYTTVDGTEVANLIGILTGLPPLLEHDIVPAFVFDGGASDLKSAEQERRAEARRDAEERRAEAAERGDHIEAARLSARTQRLTDAIQETSRELLRRLGLPVIEAPAEGEAQAAHVTAVGDADYVGTEDYDALLFGAPQTVRGLSGSGDPELMTLQATLDQTGLTREQLVDAAILCGTDYNEGISGIGPATAVDVVREHGDIWEVLDARGEHVDHVDRIRELFLDPTVTDEYALDTDIRPDVDSARTYVVEEWGIPADEVAGNFDRIRTATTQTGLDRWA
jgi:flap endonuclease-1